MSQKSCCVPGCPVTIEDSVPLHRFPHPETDADKFKTWISKIGGEILTTLDPIFVYNNRRVCRRHFEDIHLYPKNRLCKLAIPVLHIPGLPEQLLVVDKVTEHIIQRSTSGPQKIQADVPISGLREPLLVVDKVTEHFIQPSTSGPQNIPAVSHISGLPEQLLVVDKVTEHIIQRSTSGPQKIQADVPISGLREPLLVVDKVTEHFIQPSTSGPQNIPAVSHISGHQKINVKQGEPKPTQALGSKCNKLQKKTRLKGIRVSLAQHKEYKLLLKKLEKCEKGKASFKKKYFLAKKMKKTTAFNIISKKMSSTAKIFCQMQVTQSGKKKRGRRFTLEEKILALSLYKPSPKSYRFLSNLCVLPSRRTLQNLLSRISLKAGINDIIFENLKKRVDKMPESHKYCALLFDEMAIGPGVSYDKKNDKLTGFVDDGETCTTDYCDHVLVFMIRGVIKKFKQPLAFYYCSGSTKTVKLKTQIKTVIKKVQETGLKVIATVCDQGTSNIAAINKLKNETKENYLRSGQELREEFFEVGNKKIFPIFDPPHLIKGIRNNLITKNLKYKMKGKQRVAKWEHIVALYNRAPGYNGVRLVPKLTAQHVLPDLIPKMRVKHCTQVFSKSVGVAIGYMAESGAAEKDSLDTADLLLLFDDIFDSVNGSYSQVRQGKIYRTAVTPTSPHHKLWNEIMPILKSMHFINGNNQGVVPSLSSWVKTIESFKSISRHLSSKGVNSLLLRNFNQDALENFFGAIRAHGCSNIMPTSSAFEAAFKTLLINNISSSHSVGSNCEKDDSVCLQSLKNFLTKPLDNKTTTECDDEIDNNHLCIEIINTDELLKSKTPEHIERSAAIGYCSGWLARLTKKNVYKNCVTCTNNIEESEQLDFHKFIKMKEYEGKRWLCYPTRALFDFFAQVEHICTEILKEHSNKRNLSNYIKLILNVNLNINTFLTCTTHKETLGKYLINKSTMFFIHTWCKDVNSVITGKITFWDGNDPMKVKANKHYLKNKGRKRKRQNEITINV